MSVAEIVGFSLHGPYISLTVNKFGPDRYLRHFTAVSAGVHDHSAAYGAGYAEKLLHTGKRALRRSICRLAQEYPRPGSKNICLNRKLLHKVSFYQRKLKSLIRNKDI